MLPVVVGSHPDSPWLADCLSSITETSSAQRIVVIHDEGGYEPAALRTGAEMFDRFLFIHDSVKIIHPDFWWNVDASGPAWLAGNPPMFMAVHESAQIIPLLPTAAVTKEQAIALEAEWPQQVTYDTIWPSVLDRNAIRREHKHGRDNLVIGVPEVWEKWKGTWR